MTRKKAKPYWEMTTAELKEATQKFDKEFVEDEFRALTPQERAQWQQIRKDLVAGSERNGSQVIAVRVPKKLLDRCAALARKMRISRDAFIARGLKKMLADGEKE